MKKIELLRILQNGGVFAILVVVGTYFLFSNYNVEQIITTLLQVKPVYIIIGIFCMCAFVSCEAINTSRALKIFGYNLGFFSCIKYAIVGFFFCSITPSSTGGQPMQLYYMHKDKIEVSHGSLALLMELACYQLVSVSLALIGFFTQSHYLSSVVGPIRLLLFFGIASNALVGIFIATAIFSKKLVFNIVEIGISFLRVIRFKKIESAKKFAYAQVKNYQSSSIHFTKNKKQVLSIILVTLVQILALHSISFWVYKAFGLEEYSIWTIIAMQSVLYVTVSALPFPGTIGVSESSFLVLFKMLFPVSALSSAMVLSRGISFYLFVILTGIVILIFTLSQKFKLTTLT